MSAPYFEADGLQLWLGDCREILPALNLTADLVLADPPYGETSLANEAYIEKAALRLSQAPLDLLDEVPS